MKITVMYSYSVPWDEEERERKVGETYCGWMGNDLCCEGEGSVEMLGMLSFLLAQCLRSRYSASSSVSARGG
jgi:hypothetical protein